ncbi:MAG: elongation factor 1-alpha C-terminal domain-related protein, partial [Terriglobales bacterium]
VAGDFHELAEKLGLANVYAVPISALEGDNVVRRSHQMKWFDGPALLQHLEEIPGSADAEDAPLRFPVQYVIRPDQRFRGFAGTLASGNLRVRETVVALPSGLTSRVRSIVTYDGELQEASADDAITVTLEDELDVSRGDMLVSEQHGPVVSRRLQSKLVWMHADPLDLQKMYLLKHTTRSLRARVTRICHRVDVNTFAFLSAHGLEMNDIASVEIETTLPVFFDPYRRIRGTGSFILIDPMTNATVAAGMIERGFEDRVVLRSMDDSEIQVTVSERFRRLGHAPAAIVASRKEMAAQIERTLFDEGWYVALIEATHLAERELHAAASALYKAGIVSIFIGASPEALQRICADHLFMAHDLSVVDQLRAWRAGTFGSKETKQ